MTWLHCHIFLRNKGSGGVSRLVVGHMLFESSIALILVGMFYGWGVSLSVPLTIKWILSCPHIGWDVLWVGVSLSVPVIIKWILSCPHIGWDVLWVGVSLSVPMTINWIFSCPYIRWVSLVKMGLFVCPYGHVMNPELPSHWLGCLMSVECGCLSVHI